MTAYEPTPRRRPLFELGRCEITPAARELLERHDITPRRLLLEHIYGHWQAASCPWGRTSDQDHQSNLQAIRDGSRIMGFYSIGSDDSTEDSGRVWVVTEATLDSGRRWLTTILLPREY